MLIVAHTARAQQSTFAEPSADAHHELRLSWVRSASASSCPDAARVETDVERRLGWSPFLRTGASSESIEASVTRDNDVWRAEIELRSADGTSQGTRNVESSANSCASLAAAAGLAIALMIEPLLPEVAQAAQVVTPTVPETPSGLPLHAPNPTPEVSDTGAKSANSEVNLHAVPNDIGVALGALAVSRVLPRGSLGPMLLGELRLIDGLYLVVSGSVLPEQHLLTGGADVGFGMSLGTLGGCYRIPFADSWSISSCASLLLGSMQVFVNRPEPVDPGSHAWWGAGAGLHLGWNLSHFQASLGMDALAHFKRQSYVIDRNTASEANSLFVEPSLAAAGSLVAGVRY